VGVRISLGASERICSCKQGNERTGSQAHANQRAERQERVSAGRPDAAHFTALGKVDHDRAAPAEHPCRVRSVARHDRRAARRDDAPTPSILIASFPSTMFQTSSCGWLSSRSGAASGAIS
jgi:hypothetical protein